MFLRETTIDKINIEIVNKSVNVFIAEFNEFNLNHLKATTNENQKEYLKSLEPNKPENYLKYLLDTLITWKYIPMKLLNIK
jgi:hypothetical protein